ncbi:hypothetical protein BCR32DRAFT_277166 [Anaeromyces robustus]|uniref:N-acetyltransferase domain-containing protein n=1 Tax=Anaeromyces robustus TaxID=1754192 RepID=A0A1Y1XF34_9FUNG|nr:hypothetical protein BCR32DRAFT_277166 [Anaeromyces robustus]|eukprot:ORX84369.1 hypothetical protein BCR32DRAFT_277166 [Anaeromyces robustus]
MSASRYNHYQQLPDFQYLISEFPKLRTTQNKRYSSSYPDITVLERKTVHVEKLNMNHASDLYEFYGPKGNPKDFTYLFVDAIGSFSLMRIDTNNRVIEIDKLQKLNFLLCNMFFENMKYRRYEWKCDDLNSPSRNSALRLGFTFEGRTRDTAWFSIIDSEWEEKKRRLQKWLSDDNFDENGKQKQSLNDIN